MAFESYFPGSPIDSYHPTVVAASQIDSCSAGTLCFELVKGIPATAIALIVAVVAARQYFVARAKLKLDLFDKRYAIFLQTWTILSEVATKGIEQRTTGLATPFNNFLPQAAFLFGKDIEKYLGLAHLKWAELWAVQVRTKGNNGMLLDSDVPSRAQLEIWFMNEANGGAKKRFEKYLNFERWK